MALQRASRVLFCTTRTVPSTCGRPQPAYDIEHLTDEEERVTSDTTDQGHAEPFVAIQIGAVSFVDEGVTPVLDILQERAHVNALLLANPTWTRGTGGRQVPGQPFPDHGAQEPDDFRGGAYNRIDPRWYGKTAISPEYGHTDPEIPAGFDLFEAVLPEAQRRGIRSYAWMEESCNSRHLHAVPNFAKSPRGGRLGPARATSPASATPTTAGGSWAGWRTTPAPGPWTASSGAPSAPGRSTTCSGTAAATRARNIACFCEHCQQAFRERGYSPQRGIDGLPRALRLVRARRPGRRARPTAPSPPSGACCSTYPEILAWEKLWSDGQHQLSREIYGTVKAADPAKEVGVHVYHELSFSPWYRAEQDYADLKRTTTGSSQ